MKGNHLFTMSNDITGKPMTCFFCCLPIPMTLASRGSTIFPFVVHQPASPSYAVEDMVCVVCECYRGGIVVMDVIWRRLCVSMI